ncbi:MAG: gamma-glutamylcyclotransferase [Quadrisphaera sp.]
MALYAAYASNLHPERMSVRAPHSPLEQTGWLRGWRLTFGGEERGWDGALATVVEVPPSEDPDAEVEHQVFVALYDLTEADADQLDKWEGVDIGLYTKVKVRVDTLEGERLAWTYVLDDYEGGLPSAFYLGMLADAAEAAGAPDDYVAELRSRPCRSVG